MVLYRPALLALALAAGASAVVASAVMLTQQSTKAALAWSTVAQMGFMLVECGIRAFAAAALHLVAHSFYKAHAFLTAGDIPRSAPAAAGPAAPSVPAIAVTLPAALTGYRAVAFSLGISLGTRPRRAWPSAPSSPSASPTCWCRRAAAPGSSPGPRRWRRSSPPGTSPWSSAPRSSSPRCSRPTPRRAWP